MVQSGAQPLLRVKDVAVHFGGIVALDGVSFEVARGRIVGLIGPNGAGKTTLFNCVSRLYDCDRGEIAFDGGSLLAVPRHRVAALGIGRTFQNLALFRSMSVLDNVMVGYHCRSRGGFLANALRLPHAVRAERRAAAKARAVLALLGLEALAAKPVAELPFGTQKRVELARALASEPKLLLLDEPASGLNHEEVGELGALIRELRERLQLTILLVEHHMSLVMGVAMEEKSITALLGANGAGKTTTLRALCGMVKSEGQIRFRGERIDGRSTEDIARLGIAHVPDGRGTFLYLTAEENLRLGAYTRRDRAAVEADLERVFGYFPQLRARRAQQAGTLSGGEQQMLAVSRALMLAPKLMLLDEPSFGLAPLLVRELFGILRAINERERSEEQTSELQ